MASRTKTKRKKVRRRRQARLPLYELPAFVRTRATVAKNVRRLRTARDWTQEEAAARAEITLQVWQRVETGKTNASLLTLARVAHGLGVDAIEFFRE